MNLHFYNHRCEQKFLKSKNTFLQQTLNVEINDTILQINHLKNLYEETLFFIFRNFRIQDIKWYLYVHNKISLKQQQNLYKTHETKFNILNKQKSQNLDYHYKHFFNQYGKTNNLYLYQNLMHGLKIILIQIYQLIAIFTTSIETIFTIF